MHSIEFIKLRIEKFVNEFIYIRCAYKFDSSSNTHLIEVLPNSVYNTDEKYFIAEEKFISDFIDLFSNESICFITDTSLVRMNDPMFVKEGIEYNLFKQLDLFFKLVPAINAMQPNEQV